MPNSLETKEMVNLFRNKVKDEIKLGKQIGTPSAYGAVFEIKGSKNKVIKIYKSRTLGFARREGYISVAMGREGIGPKVYKIGMVGIEPGNYVIYCVMEKFEGDLYSLKRKHPLVYKKMKK